MTGWRSTKDSLPPLNSAALFFDPEIMSHYWAFVSTSGMVEFAIPWDQVKGYTV